AKCISRVGLDYIVGHLLSGDYKPPIKKLVLFSNFWRNINILKHNFSLIEQVLIFNLLFGQKNKNLNLSEGVILNE
ncbi:MAG: hypothetical protein KAS52_08100, partial [Candidatus Heimdallarchaeota archaeon]|nr:hypothetical protein [Candidatus Heimdallarchaeota archaeon]